MVVAFSFSVSAQGKSAATKAGLEKTVNTFFGFVKANNVDKIKSYYTTDYTFTDADGRMMNAEERAKMFKDGSNNTFVEMSDLSVRTYGTSGLSSGIATTRDPSGNTLKSRFIQVWTWQAGRWRLAASQITSIK
jgi:ketosteroid isomerase-like protein